MAGKPKRKPAGAGRDPERSQERIRQAALREFAAKGFAGARVDAIARRAAINKRMLYHYFGDKEGLFREVLRRKIAERGAIAAAASDNPVENLPFWFEFSCKDADWLRLLEWEALQTPDDRVIDREKRREATARGVARVRRRQASGHVTDEFDARHLMLAMQSLTMFPLAFPQLTRLIMGRSVFDPQFQRERSEFLRRFAEAFLPRAQRGGKTKSTDGASA
jgi:TetR/AcrR family transcriptional regulator